MINQDFLKALNKLSIKINKRTTSPLIGERESVYKGQGLVFADRRMYVVGDDTKAIDWKVFARTGQLHIKLYEAERNLTSHIIIDFSASMGFGKQISKTNYASMLGLGFAYMALRKNEKFVLSTFSDNLDVFRPKKGKKQLVSIVDYLNKKKPSGHSRLYYSLSNYKKLIKSRSLIVIISDFLYDTQEIRNAIYSLKNNELVLIQLLDASERDLNFKGDFHLKDSESGTKLRTFIGPLLKKIYSKNLQEHQSGIQKVADEVKAKFYRVFTDESIFDVFYKIASK
ncbi:DUF58 domain-containing protein [Candidatus Woesearchaeota archaeon]|nr:DUF58 domain-containing protein [Candidatus Woesearchaeota archaeon]